MFLRVKIICFVKYLKHVSWGKDIAVQKPFERQSTGQITLEWEQEQLDFKNWRRDKAVNLESIKKIGQVNLAVCFLTTADFSMEELEAAPAVDS